MAQPHIQTSFASGEWAPKLRSRVDIQKYHSGAELLRNFYVDFSGGGASTRQGTKFVNQAFNSTRPVRLIGFQPGTYISYVLEFGDGYIRFHTNGAPILEASIAVTSTLGNSITTASNPYAVGDWVFIGGAYYIVTATGATFHVSDLFGNTSVTPTGTTVARVYTLPSPFAAGDLFPNPVTQNPGIKFVQDVTSMIICHPSYQPQILTIVSANNWMISSINFGTTIGTPTGLTLTTTLTVSANNWNYGYTVTAVDLNGQESAAATLATLIGYTYLGTVGNNGTNSLSWTAVPGAVSYNVYKASPLFNTAFPTNVQVGFIGNTPALSFQDPFPGFGADFSQTPPIPQNPFQGAGVQSYTVTNNGAPQSSVPTVTVATPPPGGSQATAAASLSVVTYSGSLGQMSNSNLGDPTGSFIVFPNGVTAKITSAAFVGFFGGFPSYNVNSDVLANPGSITGAGTSAPGSITATGCSAQYFNHWVNPPTRTVTWGVVTVGAIAPGAGYTVAPTVSFSPAGAAATAVLGTLSGGNPGVPGFIQERLCLAGQQKAVQSFNFSQPGSFFNFNITDPIEADDAISGQIISEQLNDIRSVTPVPTGLLAMTGRASWLINGGGGISTQAPITPADVTAQPQSFSGANDLPPLKISFDILYGTNKGSYVRDLSYNVWQQLFTGADISTFSNHLFFGHYLIDWAYSEEPFKTIWATRDDGTLLSLGYVKEQEMIGWAHHDTNGQFKSVCTVFETVVGNTVDAIYVVVQRIVNNQVVQYIERMADRYFPYGYADSWSLDCALQTIPQVTNATVVAITGDASAVGNTVTLTDTAGLPFTLTMATNNWVLRTNGGIYRITGFTSTSVVTASVVRVGVLNPYSTAAFSSSLGYTIWQPVTTISGLSQLENQTVVGVADGVAVGPLSVSATGSVTLANAATKVTLGLAFIPQLKTLRLDQGQPTIQSKRKKLPAATLRVADTLGLQVGTSFANAVTCKDFTLGNLNIADNVTVTDLYSGDGFVILDQLWQEPGQLVVQQNLPYPATILSVMPQATVGDTPNARAG